VNKIAKVNIKGVIVSNGDLEIYEWFGIDAVSPKAVEEQIAAADGDDLEVDINSGGGDVYAGSEIYSILKEHKGDVTVRILGIAASAASVIAMAGKKVTISPTAQIMIHNTSTIAWGDHRALKHESEVLKNWNKSIANAYILKSGMSEEEALSLMGKETWFTAQQAKEKGLVDEIMFDNHDAPRLAASLGAAQLLPPEVVNRVRNEIATAKTPPVTNNIPEQERTPSVPLSLLSKKMNLRGRVL